MAAARELISQREYARRRGISNVSVHRAIQAGRISTVDGKIDPEVADREWLQNTDLSKPLNRITGAPKHRRNPGEMMTPMGSNGAGEEGISSATGYAKARAAREVLNAQLAKLEYDQKRGELVKAADVRVAAFQCARKARDLLVALPERVAALLAATSDAGEVVQILDQEIERICLELAGE